MRAVAKTGLSFDATNPAVATGPYTIDSDGALRNPA